MAQVRFNLRPNQNKDHHIQLIYRMDADRKKLVIGTKLHVSRKYWNEEKMRVRETKEFPDFEIYNAILDAWSHAVGVIHKKYLLMNKNPSRSQFRRDVIAVMKGEEVHKSHESFTQYYKRFIDLKKQDKVTIGTIKQYQNALNHVNDYRKKRMHNGALEFQDMDRDFFLKFINYLKKDVEDNTIHKIIKKIRTVITDASMQGIEVHPDYKLRECQVSYVKQPKFYLSLDEIEMIESVDLEHYSRLDKVRDLFLIGVWTGLRFSDLIRVNKNHISKIENNVEVIKIKSVKTKSFVIVPLKDTIKRILEKYDGQPPSISEVKFNLYLKELCKMAKINTPVFRVESGKQIRYEKFELISSHVCRRSFATNAFKEGLHPKFLMPITGHTTVKQFMDYISIDEEESVVMASQNSFFK